MKISRSFWSSGIALLLAVLICAVVRAEEIPGLLTVELSGLQGVEGSVYIGVYDSGGNWLGEDMFLSREVVIQESLVGELVLAEIVLPVGEYALSVFYDRNGNGELDTNLIGIPKEPIALSNNAKGKFGPPRYADAKFKLGVEPMIQRITMRRL